MKKLLISTLALLGLVSTSVATATVITETYSYSGGGDFDTNSTLAEGEYINFGFDMLNAGGLGPVPASFSLSQDAVNADVIAPWATGSLSLELYSIDPEFEITSLTMVAQNISTLEALVLDNFMWNKSSLADPIYTVTYNLTNAEMGIFNDLGLVNVGIGATTTGVSGYNDFSITSVSMSVSDVAAVPEPGILLLLSVGLLGFGAASRIRRKA